jgi:hypothetical protein
MQRILCNVVHRGNGHEKKSIPNPCLMDGLKSQETAYHFAHCLGNLYRRQTACTHLAFVGQEALVAVQEEASNRICCLDQRLQLHHPLGCKTMRTTQRPPSAAHRKEQALQAHTSERSGRLGAGTRDMGGCGRYEPICCVVGGAFLHHPSCGTSGEE